MKFSVIIASYNREKFLRETLLGLVAQQPDSRFFYEVIVADNNSTDGTAAMIQGMAQGYPVPLKYQFESLQGKAFALNRGLECADGDVLIFTDDDGVFRPDWLTIIYETFLEYGADGVGGRVLPMWIGRRPSWMTTKIERQLGVADHGDELFVVKDVRTSFIGPCMAYTRKVIDAIGRFDERRLMSSEDVDYFRRAFQAGFKLVYQPKAVVLNKMEAERFSKKGIARRFFLQGKACAYGAQETETGRTICRIPLWVIRRFLALHVEYVLAWFRGDRDEALWCWLERHLYWGTIWHCFKDWRSNAPIRRNPETLKVVA